MVERQEVPSLCRLHGRTGQALLLHWPRVPSSSAGRRAHLHEVDALRELHVPPATPTPAPALPTDPNASGASELARNMAAEREHSCVRLQLLWLLRPARARTLCGRRRRLVQWESAVVRKTIYLFNFAPFQS
jgi:hypothetical protein